MRAAVLEEVPGEFVIADVTVDAARSSRGPRAHGRGRGVPQRSALHGRPLPVADAGGARARVGGRGRSGGARRHLRGPGGPRDQLRVDLLRGVRAVPHRPPVPLRQPVGAPWTHRTAAPHARRRDRLAVRRPRLVCRTAARPRAGTREDPCRHPPGPRGAVGLCGDDRRRRGLPHRRGRADVDGGRRRVRRDRAQCGPGRADRRGRCASSRSTASLGSWRWPGVSGPPTSSMPR